MERYEVTVDEYGTVRFYKPGTPSFHHLDGRVDGKLHRLDGPAVQHTTGAKFWYVDGKLHRTDGPAAEWAGGTKYWFINGVSLTEEQFKEKTAPVAKELTVAEIEKLLGHKVKVIA